MAKVLQCRESMSITGAWVGVVMAGRGCGTLRCIFFLINLCLVASVGS